MEEFMRVSKNEQVIQGIPTGKLNDLDKRVKTLENNPGGSSTWGNITGTLSNQADLQTALNSKQATLVSGTNIKTINGNTLLGSGDILISGSLTKGIVEVDFGSNTTQSDIATVSVVDATITPTSYPSVSMYALATTDHDPDDYMVEGLVPFITNVSNGVGFDISVRAPNMTFGKYKVTYQF